LTLEIVDLRGGGAQTRPAPARIALDPDVVGSVRGILGDVRERGEEAVLDATMRFDGADLRGPGLVVSPAERRRSPRWPTERRRCLPWT